MTALTTFRLLTADVDPARPILSDADAGGFLALHGLELETPDGEYDSWFVRRAAADALDAIATSELLVSKVIRTQDLTTDGAKVSAELRALADRLRNRADADESEDSGGLSVVEFSPWPGSVIY